MPEISRYIQSRLRQAREDAGLTQYELADRFGSTQGTISGIERGRVDVSAPDLARLAAILRKPITYFFLDADLASLSEDEQKLLHDFRLLSQALQKFALDDLERLANLQTSERQNAQREDDKDVVDLFLLQRELWDNEDFDEQDRILHAAERGEIEFLSESFEQLYRETSNDVEWVWAVRGGFAGTRSEARRHRALEDRLIELWRSGRLRIKEGRWHYRLDSRLELARAWRDYALELVSE